eukprot:1161773-Pelagomonas_calceolata.AAC.20
MPAHAWAGSCPAACTAAQHTPAAVLLTGPPLYVAVDALLPAAAAAAAPAVDLWVLVPKCCRSIRLLFCSPMPATDVAGDARCAAPLTTAAAAGLPGLLLPQLLVCQVCCRRYWCARFAAPLATAAAATAAAAAAAAATIAAAAGITVNSVGLLQRRDTVVQSAAHVIAC